ncbi:MAG: type II toxin-antitoxin system RelE/ParE family toxin [Candidatus Shapirobacteria bacterium]|nr:type II toxin-antitoxin system RelE/ParE family toxin [Candidatus Shapirobacteria bacterium]
MAYEICILKVEEFKKFVNKLDCDGKARLTRDIDFLKENGSGLKMPFAKKIDKKLWELRTSGKQKIRIIYSIVGTQIYVVNWFIKKTQKTPIKELKTAIKRLTEI